MIYNNVRDSKLYDTVEVDIICSKCKTINTVLIDRVSKLNMCCCPSCGNIDIERTAKGVPVSVLKQLKEKAAQSDSYTVEGKPIIDFITDLDLSTMSFDDGEPEVCDDQSVLGTYRLRTYYARAKTKKTLNMEDFPDFEQFMRWSIKAGYRDWKTLVADEDGFISKRSTWQAGGYTKKSYDSALSTVTSAMTILRQTRAELRDLFDSVDQQYQNGTISADNVKFIRKKVNTLIKDINVIEAEVEQRM